MTSLFYQIILGFYEKGSVLATFLIAGPKYSKRQPKEVVYVDLQFVEISVRNELAPK